VDGETVIDDLVKGPIVFRNGELDDFIILRSDGSPVYNFCVVVDDVDMRISHILRGDDHVANTPRQILLYRALEAPLPQFAHLPLILGADKARLSKRHGASSVFEYREQGYLPDALVNFLARLGWSHGDQEIFTRAELIEHFSLDHVGAAPAVFNQEKLLWLNFQYLKTLPAAELDPDATSIQPPPPCQRRCSTTVWPASPVPDAPRTVPLTVTLVPNRTELGALIEIVRDFFAILVAYARSGAHCLVSSKPTAQNARPASR